MSNYVVAHTKKEGHSKWCRLTDKDKEYIKKHFGRGKMSNRQIALHIGCDEHTVKAWADRLGLDKGVMTFFSEDNDKFLRENIHFMRMKDIAEHYGCHPNTVSDYAKAHHLLDDPLPDKVTRDGVTYKKVTDTVHVSRDGMFLHNGKPHKALYRKCLDGHRSTVMLYVNDNGKTCFYQASRLVAKAWLVNYSEDMFVGYKDGDLQNICADNLTMVSESAHNAFCLRNTEFRGASLEQRKTKLNLVIEEAGITLHYLKTADINPLNKHVEAYLYPCLMQFCRDKLFLGQKTIMQVVPECVANLYEKILNGACVYNYERLCKKMLMNYKKTGSFGHVGDIPKPIEIIVEQLNTDCLWKKYKVTKLK